MRTNIGVEQLEVLDENTPEGKVSSALDLFFRECFEKHLTNWGGFRRIVLRRYTYCIDGNLRTEKILELRMEGRGWSGTIVAECRRAL